MKFGLFSQTLSPVGTDPKTHYDLFVDYAQEAERLGFWSLWTTEHHFSPDKSYRPYGVGDEYALDTEYDLNPDPLVLLAYTAAKTSRIKLGTAVLCLPWDHPLRAAERAAMVDVLSGGRLELGVGRGGPSPNVGDVFDVPKDPARANAKFREEVEIIMKAWGSTPFSHKGEFYEFPDNLQLLPKPVQDRAPLWIGSASDESAVWAAENGLPYATIAWPLTIMEGYKHKRRIYLDAADKAGVDVSGNDNACLLYSYVGESDAEAAETAEKYMRQFMFINEQHYQMFRKPEIAAMVMKNFGVSDPEEWLAKMSVFPIENHVIGSAKTVVGQLKHHQEEMGLTYPLLNIGWGMMPKDKVYASMRRMAEEVMPHFAMSPAAA